MPPPELYASSSQEAAGSNSYIAPVDDSDLMSVEKRGRKRHGVWDHYTKVDQKAQCNYCSKLVRARPNETMRMHLHNCEHALATGINLRDVFPDVKQQQHSARSTSTAPAGGNPGAGVSQQQPANDDQGMTQVSHGYVPIAVKAKGDGKIKKVSTPQKHYPQAQNQQRFQPYLTLTQQQQTQQLPSLSPQQNSFSISQLPMTVDYSVYLVTDSGMVPPGSSVVEHVRMAVNNGTTIVQLREKTADTRAFIKLAREVHEVTAAAGVPLIINDRVDVALAIDAEGVHVGQDDMDAGSVRRFLNNPSKIVGVSVRDVQELEAAIKDGANYVGIGAVFGTQTKVLAKAPIGVYGLKSILEHNAGRTKTVAIGGINHSNVQRVIYASTPYNHEWKLDGVAVVSCIMASTNPGLASQSLARLVRSKAPWESDSPAQISSVTSTEEIVSLVPLVLKQVAKTRPLLHHITNDVVKNFSANVSLAVGGSPAMSECSDEFEDFSKVLSAALLVNMGMPSPEGVEMYLAAIREYNSQGRPVVFDPVGAGASDLRKSACKTLLESSVFHVVKGNEGEIFSAAGVVVPEGGTVVQGVDSIGSSSLEARITATRSLATKFRTTVLMTGPQDVLVDPSGHYVLVCDSGHEYMGAITGSGCSLGSVISACVAVMPEDAFLATAAALLVYTMAGEQAGALPMVRGPGTFLAAFVDEIYAISKACQHDNSDWLAKKKIKFFKVPN